MNTTWLWSLAALFVFIDGGMTYLAVTGGHADEGNPVAKDLIEEFGLTVAIAISMVIRLSVLTIGYALEGRVSDRKQYIPIIMLLPVAASPVFWNLFVLFG